MLSFRVSFDSHLPDALVKQALVTDAMAAHAADSDHDHEPPHLNCLNCGTPLIGRYCHRCGQHDFDFHRSFWHVFLEALENFFHFDTKLFRDVHSLLFRPGRLSAAFNAGKRASQMPPFRLYVFTAFVFFLVIFSSGSSDINVASDDPASKSGATAKTIAEGLDEVGENLKSTPASIRDAFIAAQAKAAERAPDEESEKNREIIRWVTERSRYAADHQKEIYDAILHAIPKLMLVCMPFFALFTRVLYRKSGQVYLQHLVIALHFHTFIYLWVLCTNGWSGLAGIASDRLGGLVTFACYTWVFVYPFIMLRTLFGNSWLKTIFKTSILAIAYATTLGTGFLFFAMLYFVWL
jgi:hypothetical protein